MQAVQVDSTLYISGQIGFIPSTMEVMGQTKEDYKKDGKKWKIHNTAR